MIARSDLKSGYIVVDIPVGLGGAIHQLYIKEHTGKEISGAPSSSTASMRTVFVGNVDLSLDMSHEDIDAYLRQLMGQFGDVEAVLVSALETDSAQRSRKRSRQSTSSSNDNGNDEGILDIHRLTTERSRFAHVRYTNKKGLSAFLKAARQGQLDFIASTIGSKWGLSGATGTAAKSVSAIRQSLSLRNRTHTVAQLKQDVNAYMQEFEELENVEKANAKAREASMDGDGFTLVKARDKRKKAHAGDGKGRKRQKKHKGTIELKNFYRFQFREQKKDALVSLREAFAKDQEKIAQLKEQRKFKPF